MNNSNNNWILNNIIGPIIQDYNQFVNHKANSIDIEADRSLGYSSDNNHIYWNTDQSQLELPLNDN